MLDWLLSLLLPRPRSRINTNPGPPKGTQRPPAPPPPPKPTRRMPPYKAPPPPWVRDATEHAKDLRNAVNRLDEATTSGQVEDALNSILFFHSRALKDLNSRNRVRKEIK